MCRDVCGAAFDIEYVQLAGCSPVCARCSGGVCVAGFSSSVLAGAGSIGFVSGSEVVSVSVLNMAFGRDAIAGGDNGIVMVPPMKDSVKLLRSYSVDIPSGIILDTDGLPLPTVAWADATKVYKVREKETTVPFVMMMMPPQGTSITHSCDLDFACPVVFYFSEAIVEGTGDISVRVQDADGGGEAEYLTVTFQISNNALGIFLPVGTLVHYSGKRLYLRIAAMALNGLSGAACVEFTSYVYTAANQLSYYPVTVEAQVTTVVGITFSSRIKLKGEAVTLSGQFYGSNVVVPPEYFLLSSDKRTIYILPKFEYLYGEEYTVDVGTAVHPVVSQPITFSMKGPPPAADTTPPRVLLLAAGSPDDSFVDSEKSCAVCSMYILFSECVTIKEAILTPHHAVLDNIFGSPESYVLHDNMTATKVFNCADGSYGANYFRFDSNVPVDGKGEPRFVTGRKYDLKKLVVEDADGNSVDPSYSEIYATINPVVMSVHPNANVRAHARSTLYIEYLDFVSVGPGTLVVRPLHTGVGQEFTDKSVELRYVKNFIVIDREWENDDYDVVVEVSPGFAYLDVNGLGWEYTNTATDFLGPEVSLVTRAAVKKRLWCS
jgi:hypothetical protein